MGGRFVRLGETQRRMLTLLVDGKPVEAFEGDTVLVAILAAVGSVRDSELDDSKRAGFCLMGACQDCWVWTAAGERLRACSTVLVPGMAISTRQPGEAWSSLE